MTQEQKAKAYDEALERARKQRDDYQKEFDKTDKNSQLAEILRAAISAVEMAFPELSESEDERIRKWILEKVQGYASSGIPCSDEIKMADKAIDYLVKQKKQKPIEE